MVCSHMYRNRPLAKVSSPAINSDLRPIDILCTMFKILERLMERQLLERVKCFDIMAATQSGFRSGFSCFTALLDLTDNNIIRGLANGIWTAL